MKSKEATEEVGKEFGGGSMICGESAGEMEGGDSSDLKRMRVDKFENQQMDLIIEDSHEEEEIVGKQRDQIDSGGWERGEMEGGDSPDPKRMRVDKSENQEMDLIIEDSHEDEKDQIDRRKEPKYDGGWESAEEMEGGDSPDLKPTRVENFENQESDQSFEYDDGPNFLASDDSDGLGSGPPVYHVEEFEKEILNDVDKVAADVYRTQIFLHDEDSSKQIFLLKEPPADDDCRNWDYVKRTLPIYYKRMLPNTVSALEVFHPYEWNRLPEIDLEYVRLYNGLRDCGRFPKISWVEYNKSPSRRDYFVSAKALANELAIKKLSEFDIKECLEDVFREVDVESMLNFQKEYDFYLLDLFLQKKWPKDTDRYPPPNTRHGPFPFRAVIQEQKFLRWMNGLKDPNVEKAELEKLLIKYREEVERECCSTRIRYVKFKRALAKQLKLILDDTE